MTPRTTPLPIPEGHRFWCVNLADHVAETLKATEEQIAVLQERSEEPKVEAALKALEQRASGLRQATPGKHYFRMPRYSLGFALAAVLQDYIKREGYTEVMAETVPVMGAFVGLCWHDRTFALDTPAPTLPRDPGAQVTALRGYGEAVVDELQDHYTLEDIQALYIVCTREVQSRLDIMSMASQRADFFAPPL